MSTGAAMLLKLGVGEEVPRRGRPRRMASHMWLSIAVRNPGCSHALMDDIKKPSGARSAA